MLGLWGLCGPVFNFSDTWQLVVNSTTSIVTFLMVFLIQNGQNRDARAIHLKLDELLRAIVEARNGMVNLEEMSDGKLESLHQEFQEIRELNCAAGMRGLQVIEEQRPRPKAAELKNVA